MDDVIIRTASTADADRIVEIDALTWSADVSPGPAPTPGEHRDPFRTHPPAEYLVAVLDDPVLDHPVVGYVIIGREIDIPANAHVRAINGLAVDPAAAGRGVGLALVQAAVDEAARHDAAKVVLRVLGPNERAQALYRRAGFAVEATFVGEFIIDGVVTDDLRMVRHLGGADA